MKPWMSLLNVRLAATASSTTSWTDLLRCVAARDVAEAEHGVAEEAVVEPAHEVR
jgi:hypothetical protein